MLGVACEEGFVTVVDCSKPLPSSITGDGDVMPLAHWKAHRSGIHDLAWVKVRAVLVHGVDWGHMATDAEQHIALSPMRANCKCVSKVQLTPILSLDAHWQDDTQLLTASADRSAALWDTSTGTQLSCFAGHFGGIKTLSTMPGNEAVFATGEATWLLLAGHG